MRTQGFVEDRRFGSHLTLCHKAQKTLSRLRSRRRESEAEVAELIEAKGREVTDAIAALRTML